MSSLKLTRRTSFIVAVASVVVLGFAGWAIAEGGVPLLSSPTSDTATAPTSTIPTTPGAGTDNVAIATNTKDGSSVYAISLKIVQTHADIVDPVNAAVAVSNCSDCQTVSIALEGVLVAGDPAVLQPDNIAQALNVGCTNCDTLAKAAQIIVGNDTRVRITGAGRREIASVRSELQQLRTSGLDILTIKQRVDEYAGRLLAVLQNEVLPIGRPAAGNGATTTTVSPAASTTTTVGATSTSTTAPVEPTTTSTSTPSTTTTAP